MALETPRSFSDAMHAHDVRNLLPAALRGDLLSKLPQELRQRSFFISGITQAEVLQTVKDEIGQVIEGKMTESEALSRLRRAGDLLSGTALQKDGRLKLVLSTNVDLARGYGQWKQGQSQIVLEEYPAQEFYRAERRKEPRDWPVRWAAAGGKFYPGVSDYPQGRMIAMKNDPIWAHISAFGLPYAPFDYNSGMGLKDVSADEMAELDVKKPSGTKAGRTTTSTRTIALPAAPGVAKSRNVSPVLQPVSTAADNFQAQEEFIKQDAEAARAARPAESKDQSFNHGLESRPAVEDKTLLSVLQSLFAEFAWLGIDEVFREIDREGDAQNN
jgi:hypothetical protein